MSQVNITDVIAAYEDKMSGNIALYYFQMSNISIKVTPNAFLSTTVMVDGAEKNLEDVAQIYQTDDYTASIVPMKSNYLIPIIKGVKRSHPEFDMEEASYDKDGNNIIYLLCRMPEVNDDRYKVFVDAVNAKHDTVMAKLKKLSSDVKIDMASALASSSADVIKDIESHISEVEDNCYTACGKMYDDKLAEIEAGHEKYLSDVAEEEQSRKEREQSREASLKMDM